MSFFNACIFLEISSLSKYELRSSRQQAARLQKHRVKRYR
ncbi:hypothetical protein PESP_a2345 [Pseudoalteromonas espejiana DSM 9414]|nr:hypothetical protein PESP_a2345 [Pseudoalteromonas espejiana DSM 9414]